uniref:Uncharacterized protein n=1 Tax=Glossina brevipalpis TaxID=37001 RepID=A0A1A9X1H7_9MUSC
MYTKRMRPHNVKHNENIEHEKLDSAPKNHMICVYAPLILGNCECEKESIVDCKLAPIQIKFYETTIGIQSCLLMRISSVVLKRSENLLVFYPYEKAENYIGRVIKLDTSRNQITLIVKSNYVDREVKLRRARYQIASIPKSSHVDREAKLHRSRNRATLIVQTSYVDREAKLHRLRNYFYWMTKTYLNIHLVENYHARDMKLKKIVFYGCYCINVAFYTTSSMIVRMSVFMSEYQIRPDLFAAESPFVFNLFPLSSN